MNTTAPVRKNALQVWMRKRGIQKNWQFYLMLVIPVAWYVIFCYMPMYGVTLAFKKYSASKGITGSPWVDPWYKWFLKYYSSPYFARTISNTFILAASSLVFGFPLPILLALMLNEISNKRYQKFVQNITYVPHFLSTVVIVGLLSSLTNRDYGIVNKIIAASGGRVDNWMQVPSLFRPLYVGSGVWQNMGWDSIIYIAALAGVVPWGCCGILSQQPQFFQKGFHPMIDLYIADPAPLLNEMLFSSLLPMVSGERREKALSYRFPKDRAMSLAAGLLLRYAGESAFCSIAHTWSRVVLATSGEKIGCDVELKNRPANLAAAKRFFHPAEAEYLSAHPEDFLRIWTQKESYYKCNNAPFSQFNTLEMRFFAPDLSDGYVYCVYSAKKDAEIPRLHDLRNDFSLWAAAPARGK